MIIREQQMKELKTARYDQFKNEIYDKLKIYFPEKISKIDFEQMEVIIENGVNKAKKYHLNSEYDISKFIIVMFLLGEDFDRNPVIPWAGKILQNKWEVWKPNSYIANSNNKQRYLVTVNSPKTRMDRLYKMTMEYLKQPSIFRHESKIS